MVALEVRRRFSTFFRANISSYLVVKVFLKVNLCRSRTNTHSKSSKSRELHRGGRISVAFGTVGVNSNAAMTANA
jgi:hypothetical protein